MYRKLLKKLDIDPNYVKSISTIAIGNISAQAFRFLFWLVVIWIVTPPEYGYIRYSLTIANFLALPAISGFPSAITKFISEHTGNKERMQFYAFQTIFLDSLIMIFVVCIGIIFSGMFPKDIPLLSVYIMVILGLYSMYYAYVRGLMDVKRIVMFGVSVNISRVIFVFILYYFNLHGILWVMFAYSFPLAIGLLIGNVSGKKALSFKRFAPDHGAFKRMLTFALPGIVSASMWMFVGRIDVVFIKVYLNLSEVAYYSLGKTLSSIIGFVTGAVIVLQMPKISSFRENKKKIYNYTKKSLKIGFLASLLLAFTLYVSAPFILKWFFPPEYMASLILIYILIPGVVFSGLFAILGATWAGYGKPIEEAKAVFFGVISILFLNFLLIPSYGAVGSAIAFTVSQTLIFLLLYYRSIRYFIYNK